MSKELEMCGPSCTRRCPKFFDAPLERTVVATAIVAPQVIPMADPDFGLPALQDFHAQAAWTALMNLWFRGEAVTPLSVAEELIRTEFGPSAHEPHTGWYAPLLRRAPEVVDSTQERLFIERTRTLIRMAETRARALDNYESGLRMCDP